MEAHHKSSRSQRQQRQRSANCVRLLALVRLFRLTPNQVAKATGCSRPYISRLLSQRDDLVGSPEVYRALECKLGTIIEGRSSQYFTCQAVSVRRVEKVMEQMPVEPVVETDLQRAA